MGRNRTPLAKAKLTGAAAKDPQRYRDRREPASPPLGAPPKHLSAGAKRAWRWFAAEWPWLTESDGALLAPLCELRATFVEDPSLYAKVNLVREYRMLISAFGGSPTARTKVLEGAVENEGDPFAQFH